MSKTVETTREMKNSGIEWLGKIPSDWNVSKIKSLATESGTVFLDGDWVESNYISDEGIRLIQTGNVGNGVYKEQGFRYITKETFKELNCRYIQPGDILISRLASPVGRSCLAPNLGVDMICSVDICSLRVNSNINASFINYFFMTNGYLSFANLMARGATLQRVSRKQLGNFPITLPPLHEQKAIATYLDEQVEKMDGLISAQKQAIEKWKAYKQSLITEAVTKGLNPEVEMKDSGIEWIGEIPKVWEINKIKHCCYLKGRIGWQGLKSDEFIDDGPFLVTGTDFKNGVVNWETCRHISMERYEEAFQIQLKNDDMLVTKDGTIGKVALVKGLETKASLNSGVFLVRNIKNSYATKYLYYVMLSEVFWKYFKLTQNGSSTIVHLYQEIYKEFSFPFPEKHIQQAIAVYLDGKCLKIDQTIEQKQQLIKQLEEYKQSLIYECVTGKRRVL